MPPRLSVREPSEYEVFTAPSSGLFGKSPDATLALMPDEPGMEGYLVPYYTLSDRGTFFIKGAFAKTAQEQLSKAHHLYYHWPDLILGKHTAAWEDKNGFRVRVQFNEDKTLAREVMSDYRFGIGYGWSVGFDPISDRSGTEADDKRLDRSGVPHLANVPINELRAISEAQWFEGSTVPWGAIHSAKPDVIHSRSASYFDEESISLLIAAVKDGTVTSEQLAHIEQLVSAWQTRAGAGTDHSTPPAPSQDQYAAQLDLLMFELGIATEQEAA